MLPCWLRPGWVLVSLILWFAGPAFAGSRQNGVAVRTNGYAVRATPTRVLSQHPSRLTDQIEQFGLIKQEIEAKPRRWSRVLAATRKALVVDDRQVQEFIDHSIRQEHAWTVLVDFEGKPVKTAHIPRYIEAIENEGWTAGWGWDRALYIRLPGRTETEAADLERRQQIFDIATRENLLRARIGKPLPLDRFIVAETQRLEDLIQVHDEYDRQLAAAASADSATDASLLAEVRRVQAVPLFESVHAVDHAAELVEAYHHWYVKRYGKPLKELLVWVAGSDLAREIGPVAAHLVRTVMNSRLQKLEQRLGIHIVRWVGDGSGPMRAGAGRTPEVIAKLHPGMAHTVQPDLLDQPHLDEVLTAIDEAADADAPVLDDATEAELLALGAWFADRHGRLSSTYALTRVRLANLIQPINQRGRLSESALPLLVVRHGRMYLRSAVPGTSDVGYGRGWLNMVGYGELLDPTFAAEKELLAEAQAHIQATWPNGLSDPRAISGAFARFVSGTSLTTVAGLGSALTSAARHADVESLRWLVEYLVSNDGFTLSRDRELFLRRLEVLRPELTPAQRRQETAAYFADLAALDTYLGAPIEDFINTDERARYEEDSWRLFRNRGFVRYMHGRDLNIELWVGVIEDILQLLANPAWNRTG